MGRKIETLTNSVVRQTRELKKKASEWSYESISTTFLFDFSDCPWELGQSIISQTFKVS